MRIRSEGSWWAALGSLLAVVACGAGIILQACSDASDGPSVDSDARGGMRPPETGSPTDVGDEEEAEGVGAAQLRVSITVDPAWGLERIEVVLRRIPADGLPAGREGPHSVELTTEASTGRIEKDSLPPGRYIVAVPECGWATSMDLRSGANNANLKIPAPVETTIRFVDSQEKPIVEAEFAVWMPNPGGGEAEREAAQSLAVGLEIDSRGFARVQGPPGQIVIAVEASGFALLEDHVLEVPSVRRHQLTVVLKRAAQLRVRVHGATGTPVSVSVRGRATSELGWTKSGLVEFMSLPPGDYVVGLTPPEGMSLEAAKSVSLPEGRRKTVELRLQKKR